MKAFHLDTANFLAYMIPKKRKREPASVEEQEEFEWVREYSYEMKKGNEFPDVFFFTFDSNSVSYNPIQTRINLTKLKNAKVPIFIFNLNFSDPRHSAIRNHSSYEELF
jgi:hypothetical protein